MSQNVRRTKVSRMTLLALLVAVLIVLAYVNIPMPFGLSITFNMIPVAVAAMAMGLPGGMIVGGAFGLISFLQCFGVFGFSALGAALVNISPVLMFIQRFVSRVMVGVLAALVYKAMDRTRAPLYVKGLVTGFSSAFFNTLFFMSLLVLFFGTSEKLAGSIAEKGVLMYIISSVGINAVVEMAVAAVVTGAVGTALRKARML
ncbi:ECF transporter S component [Clostridiales bacterium]|nr:ECF transporter S component [Clostridiales bacterium]